MLTPLIIATAKKGWGLLKDANDADVRAERVQLAVFEDTLKLVRECEAAGGDIPLRARVMVYIGLSYLAQDKDSPFAAQAEALKKTLPWISEGEFNKEGDTVALKLAVGEAQARIIRYRHHHAVKGLEPPAPAPVTLASLAAPEPAQVPPVTAPTRPAAAKSTKSGPKGLNL